MDIDLSVLHYGFQQKPLLVGGKAMEYYGLRPAGTDTDFIVSACDYDQLVALYPDHTRDVFGDLGVCIHGFELWRCIRLFDYQFLGRDAVEEAAYRVISLEKLLFLKALAIDIPKYDRDVRLIVAKINVIQYGQDPDFSPNYFLRAERHDGQ